MRKVVVLAAAVVAALGVTASSATSAASETGVTARTIVIGGTFPLTGPASLYAPIPAAMKAYFSYINSRKGPDGKRGVYGRQIVFKYYDDGYNPANTVQQTRKLVEEDKVFALVGSLGTEHNEAIRPYMNARKVPQILNATGASTCRGREAVPVDGRLAARLRVRGAASTARRSRATARTRRSRCSTRTTASARTTSRPQGGARRQGVEHRRRGVATRSTAADVRAQVARLRGSGATIFVIFATPRFTVQAYAIANALRWSPAVIYTTSVSATDTFLTLAKSSGGGDLPNRTYTVQYAKDPANPAWDNDAGDEALQAGHGEVLPERSGRPTGSTCYGVAVAARVRPAACTRPARTRRGRRS